MKTKHLLMAGLGLISFVGMSLSSVQKAFAQSWIFQGTYDRIVQDSQGRWYLEVLRDAYKPPYIRCTSDAQYCFQVSERIGCRQGRCLYALSLINEKTAFHNSAYASACWSGIRDAIIESSIRGIDCRIYGALRKD